MTSSNATAAPPQSRPGPKVLICNVNGKVGGAEKRFVRAAALLNERPATGARVWLLLSKKLARLVRADSELAARAETLERAGRLLTIPEPPLRIGSTLRLLWRGLYLWYVAYRHDVDLVHAVLGGIVAARPVLIAKAFPVLAEVTSPDHVQTLCEDARLAPLLARFSRFHAVSPSVGHRLRERFEQLGHEALTARIDTAPLPLFVPDPDARRLQQRVAKENLVVYASRFIERKNPLLFARAAKQFLARRPDWRVAVLGGGRLEQDVRDVLAGEIAAGRVEVGYTEDINRYHARSKIFVSVIRPDNYPSQSIMEAMHAGNAIVTTDVGNTRRLVTEENGRFVDYDPDDLADALVTLADDEERRVTLGRASRQRVEEKLSPERYADHLERLYRDVTREAEAYAGEYL